MKNFITLVATLVILVLAGIWQMNYLHNTSLYAIADLEYATNMIQNNDFEKAYNHIEELEETWHNIKGIWNVFVTHEEIDVIENALVFFKIYTKQENKEEALVYGEQIRNQLIHIPENQDVKVETVF